MTNLDSFPHRRFNPLLDEWILVSPHRTQRPWQGQQEAVADDRPTYDPSCYLCPGNKRANGDTNPAYTSTFVFQNDYAALLGESATIESDRNPLFHAEPVTGECRVICFSPRHDQTLAEMSVPELASVVSVWKSQYQELAAKYEWVQVFENKGAVMGCSNPHPHCQIWASSFMPNEAQVKDTNLRQYKEQRGTNLLLDYARLEKNV